VATVLDGMGLVSSRAGWVTRAVSEHALLRELRALAERFATARTLDERRLGAVFELASYDGCRAQRLRQILGDAGVESCGACRACVGSSVPRAETSGARKAPARRFTLTTGDASEDARNSTFHTDRRNRTEVLTAKLADFR
jgi:hypothetical protein